MMRRQGTHLLLTSDASARRESRGGAHAAGTLGDSLFCAYAHPAFPPLPAWRPNDDPY